MKDQLVFDAETAGIGRGKSIISLAVLRFDLDDIEATKALARAIVPNTQAIMGLKGIYASDASLENADLLFMKFPFLDSLRMGFEVDQQTLDWWAKKPEEELESNVSMTPIGGVKKCLTVLNDWIAQASKSTRGGMAGWANSPRFDFEMLEEYYKRLDMRFPIQFRKERDVRTIRSFFELPKRDNTELGLEFHNPIHDCFIEALDMQDAKSVINSYRLILQRALEKGQEAESPELGSTQETATGESDAIPSTQEGSSTQDTGTVEV